MTKIALSVMVLVMIQMDVVVSARMTKKNQSAKDWAAFIAIVRVVADLAVTVVEPVKKKTTLKVVPTRG